MQAGKLGDEESEPPMPPGLGQLSASLEGLAEFLRIDPDLLTVAAAGSRALEDAAPYRPDVRATVEKLPIRARDQLITELMVDGDSGLVAELVQRCQKKRSAREGSGSTDRRTVGELRHAAKLHCQERRRMAAEQRAREEARRRRDAALARERHLDSLVGREAELWAQIDALIATKQPKRYERAVDMLTDLRDLDARGTGGGFQSRLEALRQPHARKPSLIERLRSAGL